MHRIFAWCIVGLFMVSIVGCGGGDSSVASSAGSTASSSAAAPPPPPAPAPPPASPSAPAAEPVAAAVEPTGPPTSDDEYGEDYDPDEDEDDEDYDGDEDDYGDDYDGDEDDYGDDYDGDEDDYGDDYDGDEDDYGDDYDGDEDDYGDDYDGDEDDYGDDYDGGEPEDEGYGPRSGYRGAARSRTPAEPPKPLTLAEKADVASRDGNEKNAFDFLYAAALAQEGSDLVEKYGWSSALKRPTLAVRWGIGVDFTVSPKIYDGSFYPIGSSQSFSERRSSGRGGYGDDDYSGGGGYGESYGPSGYASGSRGGSGAGTKLLSDIAGELSDLFLARLRESIADGEFGEALASLGKGARRRGATGRGYPGSSYPGEAYEDEGYEEEGYEDEGYEDEYGGEPDYGGGYGRSSRTTTRSRRNQDEKTTISPGVTVFGKGSTRKLLQQAADEGIDVLVVYSAKIVQNLRQKHINNDVQLVFYDVRRGEEFYKTRKLDNIDVQKFREKNEDGEEVDPVDELIEKMFDDLTSETPEGVAFQPFPDAAKPEHIQGRVTAILADKSLDTLPALSEIKYYHSRGLLDDAVLTKCYQQVLGDADGAKLVTGSEEERIEVVEKLIGDES